MPKADILVLSAARSRLGVPVWALSRTLKSTYQGGVLVYSQKYTCAVWWCKKCPLSIIFVVSAGSEASEPSRRRSPASATVAFDRPNVCRAASDGENTPIAAPTRRHLSPTSAQTTKQGWVHEKRSSTEKPFLLGQRPRGHDAWHRFQSTCHRRVRVKPRRGRQVSRDLRC